MLTSSCKEAIVQAYTDMFAVQPAQLARAKLTEIKHDIPYQVRALGRAPSARHGTALVANTCVIGAQATLSRPGHLTGGRADRRVQRAEG